MAHIKNKKSFLVVVLSILLGSIILGFGYYKNLPTVYVQLTGDVRDIFSNDFSHLQGYEVNGTVYTPTWDVDPQLYFVLDNEEFAFVDLVLNEPLSEETEIQLYYDVEGGLSEAHSVIVRGEKGDTNILIPISQASYSVLRLDIAGRVNIASVNISSSALEKKLETYGYIIDLCLADIILVILAYLFTQFNKYGDVVSFLKNKYLIIQSNKKQILLFMLIACVVVIGAVVSEVFISRLTGSPYFIWQRCLFIVVVLLSILFIYYLRGKPEKLLLSLSLIIGILFLVATPLTGCCIDEGVHYGRALMKASAFAPFSTKADMVLEQMSLEEYYNKELREGRLDELDEAGKVFESYMKYEFSYESLVYIPYGVAMFVGRCLGLSWTTNFILGKLTNLIMFYLIIYFAMKRLKYGKYLVATVSLIPTVVFFASRYTYDIWVIGWIVLGTAYFVAELQESNDKAKPKNLIIMLVAFVIGLSPKAVYFPVMLILFLLSKNKFNTRVQYRNYCFSVAISILVVLGSFALPFLISSGEGFSDMRGGTGVSASGQFSWILSHPFEYAKILVNFLQSYLSISNSGDYLNFFASLGYAEYSFMLISLFLLAVMLTDYNENYEGIGIKLRIVTMMSGLLAVVLVATALYVVFTEVGSSGIVGCQPRYLLPLVLPFMLIVRSGNIRNLINEKVYSCVVFGISTYFALSGFWTVCISHYN